MRITSFGDVIADPVPRFRGIMQVWDYAAGKKESFRQAVAGKGWEKEFQFGAEIEKGKRRYRATAEQRHDPSGRPYYWIAGAESTPSGEPDGDHLAIGDGYVSVTPLHANLTHEPSIPPLRAWSLELPRARAG